MFYHTVLINQECGAESAHIFTSVHAFFAPHTHLFLQFVLGVGYEGERQGMLFDETLVRGLAVGANAHHLIAACAECVDVVAERTCLGGASRSVVLRVEVQHKFLSCVIAQFYLFSVLVHSQIFRSFVAYVHSLSMFYGDTLLAKVHKNNITFMCFCSMDGIKTEIEITADGSATLYRPDLDEHYHSVKGALTESWHVYVECGFLHRLAMSHELPLNVLEVGYGTGLNAALTLKAAGNDRVVYKSLELYPLDAWQLDMSGFGYDNADAMVAVNAAPWNREVAMSPTFTLVKLQADFTNCELPQDIDVVYFDAFAPEKQPEMWTRGCFERLFRAMRTGGVLTTYCAKGAVRRMLQDVGFATERLPGPPGGKREILRGVKP